MITKEQIEKLSRIVIPIIQNFFRRQLRRLKQGLKHKQQFTDRERLNILSQIPGRLQVVYLETLQIILQRLGSSAVLR